ncbi:MAG: class I SAM-dependent methyltransferase [Chloroherpetonaceae bacterium]|nr:class I SAM-dependent methyltransferase [Chloroherpetonaceae bacterium]MCS7210282.1 class I SAM-dependent methyltransferase [Chloroherpetonaceae bacterium]MDW8018888.1 class I SAM-dependent methyltransferase [Chloroherpetonaceae bacterium]
MNVETLGQVFTPKLIVRKMLALRRNFGRVLEPACGNGAFSDELLPDTVAIEIDPAHAPRYALVMDFFDLPISEKFDTIIGNPPYVRFQDILPDTKKKLSLHRFDGRSNLYLFFIEKCLQHLSPNGELIFITPRDFLKATSSRKLNSWLYQQGTITDWIELGDQRIFADFTPNCAIWRFEKNNFSRQTRFTSEAGYTDTRRFDCVNGQLLFLSSEYTVPFSDVFFVKVGAVSGDDEVFTSEKFGNREFVCSTTVKDGKTRRMIFNVKLPYLEPFKSRLLKRRIKKFDETNWWTWGRLHYQSSEKRIYVNCKTRHPRPFFLHPCKDYDGSVLAIFPKNQAADLTVLCEMLNAVSWSELGFVCDGRFLFSQRSLEKCLLPQAFEAFVPKPTLFASCSAPAEAETV